MRKLYQQNDIKRTRLIASEKGQTTVEYILLIFVISIVASSIFVKLNEYLVSNPDSFQNKYLNSYRETFQAGESGVKGQYKWFQVRR